MRAVFLSTVTVLLCGHCGTAQIMTGNEAQHALTLDEVQPVLDVISRLGPLRLVSEPEFMAGSLKICFADDNAFRDLTAALGRFQGNASWLLIAHVPLVCLVAIPEESNIRGQPIDTTKFRRWILQDIAPLAAFLEAELSLRDQPSKGIQILPPSPAITGHGPGGPTYLVSDPERFLANKLVPTSPYDRTIEYWLSEQELDQPYDVLHPSGGREVALEDADLLTRISEKTYENLIILADEVARLKRQCEGMSRTPRSLSDAMQRIMTICDLAARDRLGIVVIGG
jgi:hypothetical protein